MFSGLCQKFPQATDEVEKFFLSFSKSLGPKDVRDGWLWSKMWKNAKITASYPTGLQQKMTVILFTTMWQSSFPSEMKFLSCLLQYCTVGGQIGVKKSMEHFTRHVLIKCGLCKLCKSDTFTFSLCKGNARRSPVLLYSRQRIVLWRYSEFYSQRFTLSGINPNYQTMPHPRSPHQCCPEAL